MSDLLRFDVTAFAAEPDPCLLDGRPLTRGDEVEYKDGQQRWVAALAHSVARIEGREGVFLAMLLENGRMVLAEFADCRRAFRCPN